MKSAEFTSGDLHPMRGPRRAQSGLRGDCLPAAQEKAIAEAKALKAALNANEAALTGDNRYNARFTLPKLNEYYLGQLMYFLMLTIAYEGELADVDAFDQPGVEVYKKLMKAQL